MKSKILFVLPLLALLSSCGLSNMPNGNDPFNPGPIDDAGEHTSDGGIDEEVNSGEEIPIVIDDDEEEPEVIDTEEKSDITDLSVDGITYDDENKIFTITKAGEFVFTGSFNGNIVVDAGEEDDVKITLNGFTIKSTSDAPIKCNNAGELQVSIKKGTKNYIYDYRSTKVEDDDTQGNGAITSSSDMKLSGKGSLVIEAKYNNGIHCKDDLTLKCEAFEDSSIQVKAYNNAAKGNDSIDIQSGNYVLISECGNGLITENTDTSSKGKQRGSITISGGQLDIYSAKDAIDAAYNAEITNDPVINIYTGKFSTYTGEVSVNSKDLYLRLPYNTNLSSYFYAVEFLTSDYYTSWAKATSVSVSNSSYKYVKLEIPTKATSLKVFSFPINATTLSEDTAYAKMNSYSTINTYYDTAKITQNGTSISISGWTNFSSTQQGGGGHGGPGGGGGMQEGNNDKSEVSAKGIKADNVINITGGKFFIKTYDDAIHTNYGTTFENTEAPIGVGDVNISGGEFNIYASDDGIHADHALNISGGSIVIEYSYEGLEGNIVNISGGVTHIYSTDDGVNAANKAGVTPSITVSGGYLDVTVYGQDVDGIDSNGSFTQTGGYVVTKGGNSNMSTGLDCDGSATISGGTFVAFGRTEKTPSKSGSVTSYTLTNTYSIGSYRITFADQSTIDVTTKYSYSQVNVYSDSSTKISITRI